MRRATIITMLAVTCGLATTGCSESNPVAPSVVSFQGVTPAPGNGISAAGVTPLQPAGEPALPPFNLQAVLRDVTGGQGFGLVTFRQPKDEEVVIDLDVWVRSLSPNTSYSLERAVDQVLDDVCTSSGWLTLGQGLTPAAIVTDEGGTGRAELFRALPPTLLHQEFDIHFRVVPQGTTNVVLQSSCYRFIARQ
jgi:hypothetical protein